MVSSDGFEVLRRIYVDFEGFSLRRKFLTGLEPDVINMMIGEFGAEKINALQTILTLNHNHSWA